jgi:hypothetical protein
MSTNYEDPPSCNILHSPVTSFLLGSNILLSTLFSNTINLCSFLYVRDQVSHPYKTSSRIMVLYILTFTFLESRQEDCEPNGSKHSPEFSLFLISLCMQFWSVNVVPRYLNIATSSKNLFAIFFLCFYTLFWLCDINVYLVFPWFTPRPTSLPASNKASVVIIIQWDYFLVFVLLFVEAEELHAPPSCGM